MDRLTRSWTSSRSRSSCLTGVRWRFDISGPDGATPLVVHHGTPGERSQYPPFADAAAAQGLRYVSYSRPGYGGSSRQPGRAVADCAAGTAAILAHLGADHCYTVGASGGGPHALAGPTRLQVYLEQEAKAFASITAEQVAVALGISPRRSM
jgi:pimeloyl-ACP methyl ester carboxylesterase